MISTSRTHCNSRSREGSDTPHYSYTYNHNCVSIHAPVKGATLANGMPSDELDVSIHAPVKGATPAKQPLILDRIVSIHAPVKGAT